MPKGLPKKKRPEDIFLGIIVMLVAVFVLYLGAAVGVATDGKTDENGGINFNKVKASEYMDKPKIVISNLMKDVGNARKGAMISGFSVFVLYFGLKSNKRLHRKGEEHGSAKFANQREMQTLRYKPSKISFFKREPLFEKIEAKTLTEEVQIKVKVNGKTEKKKAIRPVTFTVDKNFMLTDTVKLSMNTRHHSLNLNVLICGGTRSGKTYRYVKPNLMQANCSYIATDPKGEILSSCGRFLEEAGYEVKVLNLIDTKHSHNYNPFNYVYDENGKVNPQYVIKMISVFMTNTTKEGGSGGDQFWEDSASSLLTACAFLLLEEYSKDRCNFAEITKLLKKFHVDMKNPDAMSELDELFYMVRLNRPESLAVSFYTDFKKAAPETAQSIVMSCNVRLQKFNIPEIANLTHTDNLDLSMFGDKKTALFIIIPATDRSNNFLAAMFYTQMFDSLYNRANFVYPGKGLPIHVRCILDEFANCGRIPDFGELLATMNGMNISATVILQNLAQLKEMYEKGWENIKGNCSSFLYLGGQELATAKEISETLGKETIDIAGKNRTKGKQSSTSENNSIVGRELLTPDEVMKIDTRDCILLLQAHNPFYGPKIESNRHRHWKYLGDSNPDMIYTVMRDVNTAVASEKPRTKGIVTLKSISRISHKSSEVTKPDDEVKEHLKINVTEDGEKTLKLGDMEVTSQIYPAPKEEIDYEGENADETEVADFEDKFEDEKKFSETCKFDDDDFDEIARLTLSYSLDTNMKGVGADEVDLGDEFPEETVDEVKNNFISDKLEVDKELPQVDRYLEQSHIAAALFDDEEDENF